MEAVWVTEASALPDYRLWVRFSDGSEGEVHLKDFVFSDARAIVTALRDAEVFAAIRVDLDTVVWANGLDLAPEYLYENKKAPTAA